MSKTQILLDKITKKITSLNIAWYIKEESVASLKYLHRYKLKNIEKNLNIFCEYLEFLNLQNIDKIDKLGTSKKGIEEKDRDLSYYFVSDKKLTKKEEQLYLKKIRENGYELLTLIQWIKGILILSIDEFCNASQTRMGIHKLLMNRETEYVKKKK